MSPISTNQEGRIMNTNAVGPGTSTPAGTAACVGTGFRIKGELSGNEDLLIEGTVEGPIRLADHKLTVGLGGKLTSDVVAREIIVHGSVKGNLRASERIEIMKNGSVVGDLTTARILIEDGASFKGSIEIDREAAAVLPDKATLARAATAAGHAQPGKAT
jgi:cytoskeletal protein CcmA (bactofilin family)